MATPILAIHGGAGTIARMAMSAGREAAYQQVLNDTLAARQRTLVEGGSALDAVTETVRLFEECPLFSVGKGAVLTSAGTYELDASIMDDTTLATDAMTCVKRLHNPILAACAVMERSEHALFTSEGAEAFAQIQGLEFVEPDYYHTEAHYTQWQRARRQEGMALLDHDAASLMAKGAVLIDPDNKFGTVGAVAYDAQGRLATATSTGGVTSKKVDRVSDTPIVGAGCFANNVAAVSRTGTGETFIRAAAAYDTAAQMEYAGEPLADASNDVVMRRLMTISGRGGLIAVDAQGNIALPFNTEGMYRGFVRGAQAPVVSICR